MKRLILLFFFLTTLSVFAQELDNISKVPPIKKGKIILTDGTAINFKQLSVSNDSVLFTNSQSVICKYYRNDIYKISKTGNYIAVSAVTGGLVGLLGAALGTSDWDNDPNLKGTKSSYIVGATIVSTALGGIIGAFIKKDNIIYKSSKPLSFNTRFDFFDKNKPAFLLTCKININSK